VRRQEFFAAERASFERGRDRPLARPGMKDQTDAAQLERATVDWNVGTGAVRFYSTNCIVAFFLGLSTVMLVYGTGIGSYNSTACRQQYRYPVERFGYSCKLLGFPTAYVENDAWGHNAHVYPREFALNVLVWSALYIVALGLLRRHLKNVYEAAAVTNKVTRSAIILELLAVPLVFLILVSDLPIRRADLPDIVFRAVNWWSVLYLPLPILACLGILLGIGGLFRGTPTHRRDGSVSENERISGLSRSVVLYLPFLMAAWIVVATMFVAFVPEVV
jgi:hypothetical protein